MLPPPAKCRNLPITVNVGSCGRRVIKAACNLGEGNRLFSAIRVIDQHDTYRFIYTELFGIKIIIWSDRIAAACNSTRRLPYSSRHEYLETSQLEQSPRLTCQKREEDDALHKARYDSQ
jgi:hypothetical protein